MIVAVGKYAEKRANAAVAHTELKGKIKVIITIWCGNTILYWKNPVKRKKVKLSNGT